VRVANRSGQADRDRSGQHLSPDRNRPGPKQGRCNHAQQRLNWLKKYQQLKAKNKRHREAAAKALKQTQDPLASYFLRKKILNELSERLSIDGTSPEADAEYLAARLIDYAATLPAEWVRDCAKWLRNRIAGLTARGTYVGHAELKHILLHLVESAREGNRKEVVAIVREALSGDEDDRHCFRELIVNWLDDKVVNSWPPFPLELKDDSPDESTEEQTAKPEGQQSGTNPSHSEDFRSVRWYGTDYTFTATQAACIKVLWEAWEHGTPELGQAFILDAAGSESGRLRDVFEKGKHPAWNKLIVSSRKGVFRLSEPADRHPL
jgi:hypothetical protein